MCQKPRFKIVYSTLAITFLSGLPEDVRRKITYNIEKSKYFIDNDTFKKLDGTDIWEFRTLYNGIAYRLFAFWDKEEETFVIATHGIIKKTAKTPRKEIEKANAIRKEWFNRKKK